MDTDLNDLGFLGSGYPFYFTCKLYCVLVILVLLSISGVINIFSFWKYGNGCENNNLCSDNWINNISLGNVLDDKK